MADDKLKRSMEAAARAGKNRPTARPMPKLAPTSIVDEFGTRMVKDKSGEYIEVPVATALDLALLGTGQGGARMAQAFWSLGYRRVAAFNTTNTDFDDLDDEMARFDCAIGGAGKNMQFAADALRRYTEDVHDLMVRGWGGKLDIALVCAGLGGGTGSGTVVPMVELARRYMEDKGLEPRVGAVVSIPSVESQMVARNAVAAFRALVAAKVSPIIVIDNARINELYRPGFTDLFPLANDKVAGLLHKFNVQAAVRAPVSFDRSELLQLLEGGIVVMGEVEFPVDQITGPTSISEAIRADLAHTVLASTDLTRGRMAGCLFDGSKEVLADLPMDYFEAGFTQLDRIIGSNRKDLPQPTVVHRGIYQRDEPGLACYTMISGLEPPHARLTQLARVGGLDPRNDSGLAHFLGVQD